MILSVKLENWGTQLNVARAVERAKIWLAVRVGWRSNGKMAEAIRGFPAYIGA